MNARVPRLIRARAPLRLGLAGGGTDVSPYCDEYGGFVLNVTISEYAYAMLTPLAEPEVRFCAAEQPHSETFPLDSPIPAEPGPVGLHKAVHNRVVNDFNGGEPLACELTTFCDAPPGSGLGSSSTIVVAMLKAYVEWLNLPLGEYDIAHLAFIIERRDLALSGGRQDQYAATFGGVNFIEFYEQDRAIVNPLRVKNWILSELEASIVLFYTGQSRESDKIINDQVRSMVSKEEKSLEALHALKAEAWRMKEYLLRGDIAGVADVLNASWRAKKQTAASVSNSQIDVIYDEAMAAGALAGKISGAGGGGFMMLVVDPLRRVEVLNALSRYPGRVVPCHFTKVGTEGWSLF